MSTHFTSTRSYTQDSNGKALQMEFGDSRLSNSLALITYHADCGYSETELIPSVLARLRTAVHELIHHCTSTDKSSYVQYICHLLIRVGSFLEKLIIPALDRCLERPRDCVSQLIVKEVQEFVGVVFMFTNPLKNPQLFFDDNDDVPGNDRLKALSSTVEVLIDKCKQLHAAFSSLYIKPSCEDGPDYQTSDNCTPSMVWNMWLDESLSMVSRIVEYLVTSTVPTYAVFEMLRAAFESPGTHKADLIQYLLFLDYFEEIDSKLASRRTSEFYENEKELIRMPLYLFIRAYFAAKYPDFSNEVCTNMLLNFQRVYSEIYDEKIEFVLKDEDNNVIYKRVGDGFDSLDEEDEKLPIAVKLRGLTEELKAKDRLKKDLDGQQLDVPPQETEETGGASDDWSTMGTETCRRYEALQKGATSSNYSENGYEANCPDLEPQESRTDWRKGYLYMKRKGCIKCKLFPWHSHKVVAYRR